MSGYNVSGLQSATQVAYPQDAQKQDGLFSQRIRVLTHQAGAHENRLRAILRNLRVPPPEPPQAGSATSLNAVHTTVEEHLGRHETHHSAIDGLLSELEGLLA